MDRVRQLWFWIRNWIANLLLHNPLTNPDQSTAVLLANTTTTAAISRREQELHPLLFSSAAAEVKNYKYDVFVSFSEEDTRRGFTTHLRHSLSSKLGLSLAYNGKIRHDQGTSSIAPELLKAIEDSRIAVVVLSRNYTSSTSWCLDELLHILRHRKSSGLRVIPIFFDVDPSDFREQKRDRSSSAEAFPEHDRVFAADKVRRRWRDEALTEVANLPGFATADYGNDSDMIKEIVEKIWSELSPSTTTFPSIISNTNPLVGMDGRVNAVIGLLRLDANTRDLNNDDDDVRMIGICGPAGSGKTTVAMAVYNAIRSGFESSTYIARVGEASGTRVGLFRLQQQLADEIGGNEAMTAGVEDLTLPLAARGFERLKRAYRGKKKQLLILDGVTHEVQLLRLGDRCLFGSGSRVIITYREQYVVNNAYQTRVDSIYETQLLDKDEARVLLCLVAFGQEEIWEDYRDLGEQILEYAGGLPFLVEVLGRSLRGRSVSEWECTIEKLKKGIPPREIALYTTLKSV